MSALDRSKGADLPKDPDAQEVQKKPSDEGSESQSKSTSNFLRQTILMSSTVPRTMHTDDDANGGATTAQCDKCNAEHMQLLEENRRLAERVDDLERLIHAFRVDRAEVDFNMQALANRKHL